MSPLPQTQSVVVSSTNAGEVSLREAKAPVERDVVSTASAGEISIVPPTFLEKWGVVFVACAGGWILAVGSGILIYFLLNLPVSPALAGLAPDQAKEALNIHKQLFEQWRDALTYIFDLLITKTALPLVTLLLGYLFGKGKS
jgi:hypothetical protein